MKFLCMYRDYVEVFRNLTDVRRGRLIMALLEYAFDGVEPNLRGEERLAFTMLRSQFERDREKYQDTCQRNRENGRRGGRPKKPVAFEENPAVFEKPKEKENEKENIKENINEKENENEKVKEKESSGCTQAGEAFFESDSPSQPQPQHPSVPDMEDIKAYCLCEGLFHVDQQKFYDYYCANGWRMGRGPMADWKAALRTWDRKDAAKVLQSEADTYAQDQYSRFLEEYVYKEPAPGGWNSQW